MLRTLPFSLVVLTCFVMGNAEVAPVAAAPGLTKFKDLSFYNNLVNFVEGAGLKKSSSEVQDDDDYETDLEGGEDDSIHKASENPIERVVDEDKPPKTLLSQKGVRIDVNKHKFVSYDTEFTLSLKWRPFRTAKSIKKMLLFFPKKIEKTAFTGWETLRGGSSKKEGNKADLIEETAENGWDYEESAENDLDWDEEVDDWDIDSDDAEWEEQDYDDCGDWSDMDEESGAGIAARNPADNYPFFVRLSSYDPNRDGLQSGTPELPETEVEAQGIFGRKKKAEAEIEETQKAQKTKKRRRRRPGYVLVDSDILVNTACPHSLSEFKSSEQQWGKKKSVFVKLTNTTSVPRIQGVTPRYFPGDRVSSAGSSFAITFGQILVSALMIAPI